MHSWQVDGGSAAAIGVGPVEVSSKLVSAAAAPELPSEPKVRSMYGARAKARCLHIHAEASLVVPEVEVICTCRQAAGAPELQPEEFVEWSYPSW